MTSLTEQLLLSADPNLTDVLGWDPWGLRKFTGRSDKPHLQEILRIDLSPYYVDGFFPKIIHFVWIGDTIPKIFQENVLQWQKINPDYLILFWHENSPLNTESTELVQWCHNNKLNLLSISNTLNGCLINESIYLNSLVKQNFGACSDILRLNLLYLFGGVYADFDVRCLEPLGNLSSPDGILLNARKRKLFYHVDSIESLSELVSKDQHYNTCDDNLVTNDLIAAMPNINDFEIVLADVEKLCLEHINDSAISYQAKKPFNKSEYLNLVIRERTIYTTGPGTLWKYFENKYQKTIPESLTFNPNKFVFYSLSSWYNRPIEKKVNVSNVDIAKNVITNIIHDLTLQPSIFSLLQYSALILQHDLIEAIIEFFVSTHYRLLANITWIWLGEDFKKYKRTFLNSEKFPKVKYIDGKLEKSLSNASNATFLRTTITSPVMSHTFTYFHLSEIINKSVTNYKLFASNLPKGWFIQDNYLRGDWEEIVENEFEFILTVKTESDVFSKKILVMQFDQLAAVTADQQ